MLVNTSMTEHMGQTLCEAIDIWSDMLLASRQIIADFVMDYSRSVKKVNYENLQVDQHDFVWRTFAL